MFTLSPYKKYSFSFKKKKEFFKVGERPMDFNVAEYEKFIDMVSDFTLQLTSEKLLLVEFWHSIKEEYHNYLKNFFKKMLPFQLHMCESGFSSNT